METITWNEIKVFCNSLNEEQLKEKVLLWREDECIAVSAHELEEDQYLDEDTDEGCVPESTMHQLIKDDPDAYPDGVEHFKKVYSKGRPMMIENF
jgi:hypothetical protein